MCLDICFESITWLLRWQENEKVCDKLYSVDNGLMEENNGGRDIRSKAGVRIQQRDNSGLNKVVELGLRAERKWVPKYLT